MSEMKHIGEPWEAIGSLVRTHYNGHGGFLVADCHTGTTFTSEQCCAHANLIAAAPDLLEALKRCCKLIEGEVPAFVIDAIAKAQGHAHD